MQINLNLLAEAVLCLLPLAFVLMVIFNKRKQQQNFKISPFKELQRRPAGETLRIKLEELDDKTSEQTMMLVLLPVMMVLILFALNPKELITAPDTSGTRC